MTLYPYQEEAIDFIGRVKKGYLAMSMGTGKTLTALAAGQKYAQKNILVIAEKNEVINSQNFKKEADLLDLNYVSLRDEDLDFVIGANCQTVCAVNPDRLVKFKIEQIKELFDFVVVDESTMVKTMTTKRFKKVQKVCEDMNYVVLLSGTPLMNGAAELYAPLLLLGHPLMGNGTRKAKEAFEVIFAGGHRRKIRNTGIWYQDYVWWAKGCNHTRELRYLVRGSFFFKRKEDTGIFNRNMDRRIVQVPMTLPWLVEYRNAWEEYLIQARKRDVDMDNVAELRNLIENGQVYQVNSRWKAQKAVEDIKNGIYGDRRIVIFSLFVETDQLIQTLLTESGITYHAFEDLSEWKIGQEQVLVGRIKAHGKGANLPEASVALFVDMDWVPANNIQAENRINRPEQKNDMAVVYYLTEGEDVVDAHVRRINQDKASKIDKFMEPLTSEEMSEMPARIRTLQAKYRVQFLALGFGALF